MGNVKTLSVILVCGVSALVPKTAAALSCKDKPNRYSNVNIFSSVKQTSNLQFGSATNPLHNNAVENLFTDVFQPNGDTCTKRPMVIMLWGGGFQGGKRQDENGDCQNFAKRGFVCATSDYRKGNAGAVNVQNFCGPLFMSTQDTRAAIRYYKKNAALYGIDTSLIFVGGCSSGAYAALQTGYLDKASEIASYFSPTVTGGGIEGNSGNPGYSSRPAGVLSLSGGVLDSNWVIPGDIPAAMVGCTADAIEAKDSLHSGNWDGPGFVSNYDMTRLTPRLTHLGVPHRILAIPGNCHCPHNTDAAGVDQSIDFLAKSAYAFMTTAPTPIRARPADRYAVAFSPRDLHAFSPQGTFYDLKGKRLEPGRNGSGEIPAPDFRPGLYFKGSHPPDSAGD
ncbi:MAG: hypothetical protein JWO30_2257 [Fibrobacteres bacterium]|nr:hypothetical protein [Fibrobacterota bacterium]